MEKEPTQAIDWGKDIPWMRDMPPGIPGAPIVGVPVKNTEVLGDKPKGDPHEVFVVLFIAPESA